MSGKSFYDLDCIIEINEQRFAQYMSAYNELMNKLTNIVLIYSAMGIFLIPIVRNVFWGDATNPVLRFSFLIFAVFFSISVFNAVRFILPVATPYLQRPNEYYNIGLIRYGQEIEDWMILDDLLKKSYIDELEKLLDANLDLLVRKFNFYRNAIVYALIALLPYMVCFWHHIANKREIEVAGVKL